MNEREMVLADATLHARFWRKVNVRGADECWNWLANKSAGRYGAIKVGGKRGKDLKAHRIQMIWQGVEVEGKVVRHKCDNPPCVNPAHLEVGSQLDNVQDMIDRGRGNHASGERIWSAKLSNAAVRTIRKRLRDGETVSGIAKDMGLNRLLVYNIAARKTYANVAVDVEYPAPSSTGESNHNAKLTEEVVAAMRRRYREVQCYSEVAREFGVSRALAARCITGARWKRIINGESPIPERIGEIKNIAARKLSDDAAREIRTMPSYRDGGMTRQAIAEKYGISKALVDAIKSGRCYSWV